MSTSTFRQPNYAEDNGTVYPTALDDSIAVMKRLAAAFAAHASDPVAMTVEVDAGAMFVDGTLTAVAAQTTAVISAPADDPRIDRVVIDQDSGAVVVVQGAEAAAPVPPSIPKGKLPVAQVALMVGMTEITNADITDERVDSAIHGSAVPVGTVMDYVGASAPTGWLLLNGDSIGSAASGGDQNSDDYEALFTLFWDAMADSEAPVSGGRGASAAADWAADKTLTLPDARGRTTIGSGTGSGLTARTHGDTGGEEEHQLTIDEMAKHGHPYRFISQTGTWALSTGGGMVGTTYNSPTTRAAHSGEPSNSVGQQIGGEGGDQAHNNMQPWLALNKIVRY